MTLQRAFAILIASIMFAYAPADAMTLASPDFTNGDTIPVVFTFNGFGCTGQNHPPRLRWSDVPAGTKALALTVWDPDAPTSVGWVHWTLFRIPPSARALNGAPTAPAVSGRNDFGTTGYGGPCPPSGDNPHHFIFTLDALDSNLPLGKNSTYALYRFMRRGHVLASARLVGRYGRR